MSTPNQPLMSFFRLSVIVPTRQKRLHVERNKEVLDEYYKEFNVHKEKHTRWSKYLDAKTKFRDADQGDSCHPENGKTAGNASGPGQVQGAQTFDVAAGC